jgi:uncharacterized membrane protein YkvA (DUF1232 family)
MDGEIIDMPDPEREDSTLALVKHPLDTSEPVPVRSRQEVLKEVALLLPNLLKLLYRLLRDSRVPRGRRLAMAFVGAYVVSPVDLIPDFVPVAGGVDDLLVVAFAIDYLLRGSPDEVVEAHWDGSEDALDLVRGVAAWGVELLPGRFRSVFGGG